MTYSEDTKEVRGEGLKLYTSFFGFLKLCCIVGKRKYAYKNLTYQKGGFIILIIVYNNIKHA